MFTLFSGRHAPQRCTNMHYASLLLCKFLRNISTNVYGLGKRTDQKLGEVSYLYPIESQFLDFIYSMVFDLLSDDVAVAYC